MSNNEISLNEIFMLFKKKWKMIVIVVLFVTAVGGGVAYLIPSTYEARTDLLVNSTTNSQDGKGVQTNEIETSLRLIETYNHILKSDRMMSNVISTLKEPYTKNNLIKNISIESSNDSQIITIIVREKTPEKTAILANSYATVFQKEIKSLMNLENINILKEISAKNDIKEIKTLPDTLIIVSLIIGIIIAAIIAILQEFYFTKLNTDIKVENALTIPNLGLVPTIKGKSKFRKSVGEWDEKLISNVELPTLFTEEFRRVRANVQFLMSQKNAKALLVTSAAFRDGKSLISRNLAIIMAMDGKKTVFVDADLRKPIGKKLFNSPERKGLTSIISGNYGVEEIVQDTETKNLSFICAGPIPPNPAEVLSSDGMKQLIEKLKQNFDVIIIDTPPLLVADAIGLSTVVDGCLYVIDAGRTKEELANKSLEQLRKVEATILGTVLNRSYSSTKDIAY